MVASSAAEKDAGGGGGSKGSSMAGGAGMFIAGTGPPSLVAVGLAEGDGPGPVASSDEAPHATARTRGKGRRYRLTDQASHASASRARIDLRFADSVDRLGRAGHNGGGASSCDPRPIPERHPLRS